MNPLKAATATAVAVMAVAGTAHGAATNGFSLQILLDGSARPEYWGRGTVYVEAVRGRPYVLRITNPLPCRVAVALAVDGLNTIDARHTDARGAAKWVLGPYETVEIPGWQVNGLDARRFFFTGEPSSYGAWLGKTTDLGVIEGVFYREKVRPMRVAPLVVVPPAPEQPPVRERGSVRQPLGAPEPSAGPVEGGVPGGMAGNDAAGIPGGVPKAGRMEAPAAAPQTQRRLSDEYAATGIGERTRHEVEWVNLELEERPAAAVRIRYEFRDALVRLGVLPVCPDPLARRERARGFSGGFCPDPAR
jgi:hypothetical protein